MSRSRVVYEDGPASARLDRAIRSVNDGLAAALKWWHAQILPIHFTTEGARRYGYQPRSGELGPGGVPMEPPRIQVQRIDHRTGRTVTRTVTNPKYAWRKRRQKHHGRPLVWSGRSEEEARAGIRVSRRGQSDAAAGVIRAVGAMSVPGYFYQFLREGSYVRRAYDGSSYTVNVSHTTPDKYKELTTILAAERSQMIGIVSNVVAAKLSRGASRSQTN